MYIGWMCLSRLHLARTSILTPVDFLTSLVCETVLIESSAECLGVCILSLIEFVCVIFPPIMMHPNQTKDSITITITSLLCVWWTGNLVIADTLHGGKLEWPGAQIWLDFVKVTMYLAPILLFPYSCEQVWTLVPRIFAIIVAGITYSFLHLE